MAEELTEEELIALSMLQSYDERQEQSQEQQEPELPKVEEEVESVIEVIEEDSVIEEPELFQIKIDSEPIGVQLKVKPLKIPLTEVEIKNLVRKELETQISKVFPEERFDVQEDAILIKFSNVTIRNEEEESLIIPELYVKLEYIFTSYITSETFYSDTIDLQKCMLFNYCMKGTASTVTQAMLNRGYAHSHLDYRDSDPEYFFRFTKFCLGDSIISTWINRLSNNFDFELFNFLLNSLEEFVRWESLDGVPYIHIRSVYQGSSSGRYDYLYDEVSRVPNEEVQVKLEEQLEYLLENECSKLFNLQLGDKKLNHSNYYVNKNNLDVIECTNGNLYYREDILKYNDNAIEFNSQESPEKDIDNCELIESYDTGYKFKEENIIFIVIEDNISSSVKKPILNINEDFYIPHKVSDNIRKALRHCRDIYVTHKIDLNEQEEQEEK